MKGVLRIGNLQARTQWDIAQLDEDKIGRKTLYTSFKINHYFYCLACTIYEGVFVEKLLLSPHVKGISK